MDLLQDSARAKENAKAAASKQAMGFIARTDPLLRGDDFESGMGGGRIPDRIRDRGRDLNQGSSPLAPLPPPRRDSILAGSPSADRAVASTVGG